MQLNAAVRETFDSSWRVDIDSNQRISVPQLDERLAGIPGIYLWLRTNNDVTEIRDGYVGESGNLLSRINDYLAPNPRGTAKRVADEMRSWKAQYGEPKITLAVVYDIAAARFQFDGEEDWHRWDPSEVSHRRMIESTHIWIGRKRGYTLLNIV